MNLDLAENTNKLILLVVAAVVLLLTLNTYQKQLGKNLAVVLSVITIVVVGYVGYNLMSKKLPVRNNANNVMLNRRVNNNVARNNKLATNTNNSHAATNNSHAATNNNVAATNNSHATNNNNSLVANNNSLVANNNGPVANNVVETFEGSRKDLEEDNVVEKFEGTNNQANNQTNNPANTNVLNCSDLLPADSNSLWAQVAPAGQGDLCNRNLLNAAHHIGVNTQGCSLRNANRGLRSEPPNPQVQVSPWLQTTICPDVLRKPLDP